MDGGRRDFSEQIARGSNTECDFIPYSVIVRVYLIYLVLCHAPRVARHTTHGGAPLSLSEQLIMTDLDLLSYSDSSL